MTRGLGIALCALGLVACIDAGRFGRFDQAEVLAFAVESQTRSASLDAGARSIVVTLPADDDGANTVIEQLELSSLASAPVNVGDRIDLRKPYTLEVTAENGEVESWLITRANEGSGGTDAGTDTGTGPGDADPGDCPSVRVTYEINGVFEVTDTPFNAGDTVVSSGPGELTLRFVSSGPGTGAVTLLSYQLAQDFTVNAPGTNLRTQQVQSAGPDACGLASGQLSGGVVRWDTCDYGPAPPLGTTAWGPSQVVGGPGCIQDFSVKGQVDCTGSLCSTVGYDRPKELDLLYPQPLNWFEYDQSLTSFHMGGGGAPPENQGIGRVEFPNDDPSRTWLSLDGQETSRVCDPLPDCP